MIMMSELIFKEKMPLLPLMRKLPFQFNQLLSNKLSSIFIKMAAKHRPLFAKRHFSDFSYPLGLMFHSDRGSQYTAFAFRQLLVDSLDVVQSFSKKGYLSTMLAVNISSDITKKKKQTVELTTHYRNYNFLSLNILWATITPNGHSSLGMLTPNEKEELYWEQA